MMKQLSGGILKLWSRDVLRRSIMKKNMFFLLFVLIVLLAPRLLVLSQAAWDYNQTEINCHGKVPTPPTGLQDQIHMFVYEATQYFVLTDQGYLLPGDEYMVSQEGWVGGGSATLLWIGKDDAKFIITYPIRDIESGHWVSISTCKWSIPLGSY